jgi:murein hydrolase activator
MRRLLLLLAAPIALAASAPVEPSAEPLDTTLERAEKEQAEAEARAAQLQAAATSARGEAAQLHAKQASAAEEIAASEARLTAADARLRLLSADIDRRRKRLTEEQQPVASLLGALVLMARQPPLLAAANPRSADELVRLRVLLDSTVPLIRSRTAALSQELRRGEQLELAAQEARGELVQSRQQLTTRREQFAALEQRALSLAAGAEGQALIAGDVALATGEDIATLRSSESGRAASGALAASLAALDAAPARSATGEGSRPQLPFAYRLPADAPVIDGLGSISAAGIRSRGVTMRTSRGAAVTAPASGVVQFAGPFREYDGILIIDHGRGWMTLLLNVASALKKGDKVSIGQPLGRAIGPLGVELSQNGQRYSPALIAGSSQNLSKSSKGG